MIAELADGTRLEFPDGTPPDVVQRTVRGVVARKAQEADNAKFEAQTRAGTAGTGGEAFMSGMGKAFADIGRGVGQLVGRVDQKTIDDAKERDKPLMNSGAGMAGNVIGNVAATVPAAFVPGANTVVGSAVLGAGLGALQPVASDDSRGSNIGMGAIGGAVGQGAANLVGRLARPVQSKLPAQLEALAQKAEQQFNIPLNAAQKTGSKPLQIIDSVLDNMPLTADRQAMIKELQRKSFNKAVLATAGETADTVNPQVITAARKRLGDEFERLSGGNSIRMTPELDAALQQVIADNAKAGPLASSKVDDVARWIAGLTQGTPESTVASQVLDASGKPFTATVAAKPAQDMAGESYQTVRSILGRESDSAFKGNNSQLGMSLKGIQKALDDAAYNSLSDVDKAAWQQARKQWQALKVIEKAAAPTSKDAVSGNVSAAKLAQALKSVDRNAIVRTDDLADLARIGQAFVKDQIPDSGTAQRTLYQTFLKNPIEGAWQLGTGGISLPVQMAINSKVGQAYLNRAPLSPRTLAIVKALKQGAGMTGAALPVAFNAE